MKIAVACDHAGFPLKTVVLNAVTTAGHSVLDLGTNTSEAVDYPDYAEKLGKVIQSGEAERGILLCGSGVGASIAANKMQGDDMNVLCMGARVVGPELVNELVLAFLSARFVGNDPGQERHKRRVGKVRKIETGKSVK
jgi:ribose 5-phosphate isomerase B